ncbi:MAG TPA: chemotaxis protein CheB [Caproicibacter sp.]|nr:chemotaxis protein CheB [Caproicibacter sp.]
MQINTVRVLILDDSMPFQTALQQAMHGDSGIRVLEPPKKGESSEELIKSLSPDVIILNEIPGSGETLAAQMGRLRSFCSIPFIAIGPGKPATDETIRQYNAEFIKLPELRSKGGLASFCNEICVKVKLAAQPSLVKRAVEPKITETIRPAVVPSQSSNSHYHVIAIGASTGGTEATAQILEQLPGDMPGIVIVQHMPADFTKMYAERLNRISKLRVSEAKDGDRVEPGTALVAAGGLHMYLKKDSRGYYVHCAQGDKVNGHCPSVGVLFDSAAACAGSDAIGVILTGMGRDGAEGLLHMRNAGAYTVGQDRESCVVYGMPMAAYDIGAVMQQAPCSKIAGILVQKTR